MLIAREDLGRHNALDKLIGALTHASMDPPAGAFVMTSRISLELVQKCAMAGAGMIIAASAPTSYAIAVAKTSCITLVGFARNHRFEVFSHSRRIV